MQKKIEDRKELINQIREGEEKESKMSSAITYAAIELGALDVKIEQMEHEVIKLKARREEKIELIKKKSAMLIEMRDSISTNKIELIHM